MDERISRLERDQARHSEAIDNLKLDSARTGATLTRLIWALLGLIGALVGKESAVAALSGQTPILAYVNFILGSLIAGSLAMWAIGEVFLSKICPAATLVAAGCFFIAAGIRINMGLHDATPRASLLVGIFLVLGVAVLLGEEIYLWTHKSLQKS